ncbi:MAG: hypothetical protein V7K35_25585 [Nostoc sp.]|uniref:hypothetical protein n=1 Tax=Nostoc sp. TaxID=1180 RepID=UPI002FF811B2
MNVDGLSTEQRLDYGIKALTTTGAIFAGIALIINAFYGTKRAEAMHKTAEAAQDRQISERFAKAIEQLRLESSSFTLLTSTLSLLTSTLSLLTSTSSLLTSTSSLLTSTSSLLTSTLSLLTSTLSL